MIAYSTLGTNDMDRSIAFYDAVFGALGGVFRFRRKDSVPTSPRPFRPVSCESAAYGWTGPPSRR